MTEYRLSYTASKIDEKLGQIDNLAKKNEVPSKTSQLTNDSGFITSYTETDPTVPAWAKAATKPSYTAAEVGAMPNTTIIPDSLADLTADSTHRLVTDAEKSTWNAKSNFSGNYNDLTNKPTIPSINGLATETYVNEKISAIPTPDVSGQINTHNTSATAHSDIREAISQLSSEKVDLTERVVELEQDIIGIQAQSLQQVPEFANSIEECTDTSKLYVLPDGFIYAWMLTEVEVETGGGCTNLIDGTNGYIKEGQRYSVSSAAFKSYTPGDYTFASIVIPVPTSGNLTVRVRGMRYKPAYPTIYGGTTNQAFTNCYNDKTTTDSYDNNGDWIFSLSNTAGMSYIVAGGELKVDASQVIATVNEEIVEGGTEIVTEYAWVSTGLAFVPANYEDRIVELENIVDEHSADIENLKKGITTSTAIKDWDAPIYDANIPVFELSSEKSAMTNATNTPANIYAKYDALMAKHPRYITKTDLGLCSDGVNHVYRYDFCEPEPLHESNKVWSETKAKAIIVTGIHFEWAGIYAMYNALEEIADNPALRNFRRNTHLIVVPVANPYATIASNYQSGLPTPNSYGVRNANGVEIHRNFEVDWITSDSSSAHYGGASPLSEVETQYIDNIMKNNTDAALFLSCHNCGVDTFWGTGFIWASTATKYMCNMGYRVVDKLSDAWMDKYGDVLSVGIEEYKTDLLENGDTRLGWASLSSSPGTEAKQATKYGIQGTNVEICDPFQIHGTTDNPEPSMSSFTMSRGAEVYANFLLTALGVYDYKDKNEYAPNLPWSEQPTHSPIARKR